MVFPSKACCDFIIFSCLYIEKQKKVTLPVAFLSKSYDNQDTKPVHVHEVEFLVVLVISAVCAYRLQLKFHSKQFKLTDQ